MADQLSIYNEALGHLKERKLATLSENREPRRVLDSYYATAVARALERGNWKFAMRTVQISSSTQITPAFGYQFAFQRPLDWVKTFMVSSSEILDPPLLDYVLEAGIWYANWNPLFIKYVSNDVTYGMNITVWPDNFTDFVTLSLARRACLRVTKSESLLSSLIKLEDRTRKVAEGVDAMSEPPAFPPVSSWVRARRGNPFSGWRE